jgi:hypothetical protein
MVEWEAVAQMIDVESDGEMRPGEPHARERGSLATACGLNATKMEALPQRWEAISLDGKCTECFSATQALPQ